MTNKIFTEEQYQLIVQTYDYEIDTQAWGLLDYIAIDKFSNKLIGDFNFQNSKEIMAIANPLTREWAHDQFVKQEKKYIWKSKKKDYEHDNVYLEKLVGAILTTYDRDFAEPLTESEIREWGYNPDKFEREDVEPKKTIYSAETDEDLDIFKSINKQIQKIIDDLDKEDSSTDAE